MWLIKPTTNVDWRETGGPEMGTGLNLKTLSTAIINDFSELLEVKHFVQSQATSVAKISNPIHKPAIWVQIWIIIADQSNIRCKNSS
jgi:hypothetical protein